MPTPQMQIPPQAQTDAEAALLELHKLLHPEAHHEGAERIHWTGETVEAADKIICEAVARLDLLRGAT